MLKSPGVPLVEHPGGRPAWEAGGALFVDDVRPYEVMKLRMLNGAHSMLAYEGFLSGRRYVRDTVGSAGFSPLIERHFKASTLPRLPGIDLFSVCAAVAVAFRQSRDCARDLPDCDGWHGEAAAEDFCAGA